MRFSPKYKCVRASGKKRSFIALDSQVSGAAQHGVVALLCDAESATQKIAPAFDLLKTPH